MHLLAPDTGLVERITYQNAENGFCVLRVKARGQREPVTLVGHAAVISAGEWITAAGHWVNDRTHGQQFKARFLKTSAPTSVEGIEKYLASGLLRAFGEKVFDVIEAQPGRLREVDGIGPVRAGRITAAWAEQKAVREIMVFLHSIHGHEGRFQQTPPGRRVCGSTRTAVRTGWRRHRCR